MSDEQKQVERKARKPQLYSITTPIRWRRIKSFNHVRAMQRDRLRQLHPDKKLRKNRKTIIQKKRHKFYTKGAGSVGTVVRSRRVAKLARSQLEHIQLVNAKVIKNQKKKHISPDFKHGIVALNEGLLNQIFAYAAKFARHRTHATEDTTSMRLTHADLTLAFEAIRN